MAEELRAAQKKASQTDDEILPSKYVPSPSLIWEILVSGVTHFSLASPPSFTTFEKKTAYKHVQGSFCGHDAGVG